MGLEGHPAGCGPGLACMPVGEDSSPASFETSGGGEHLTPRWPSSNSIVNASSGWLSAGTLNFTLTIIRLATCSQKLNLLGRSAATYVSHLGPRLAFF